MAGVNNDIVQRAQEDDGNKTANGTTTTNVRAPYVSRVIAIASHVTPVRFHADPAPPPPPPAAASAGGASILFGALRRSSMALVEAST